MSKGRLNSEDKAANLRHLFECAFGEDTDGRRLCADFATAIQRKSADDAEAIGIAALAAYHDGVLTAGDAQYLAHRIAGHPALIHELEAGAACVAAVKECTAQTPAYLKARYVAEAGPIISFPRKTAAIAICALAAAAVIIIVVGPALSFLHGSSSPPPIAAIAYTPVAAAKNASIAEVIPKKSPTESTKVVAEMPKPLKYRIKIAARHPSIPASSGNVQYVIQNPGDLYDDGEPQIGNPTIPGESDGFPAATTNFVDPDGK